MPALQRKAHPNGHIHKGDLAQRDAQCPTCGSLISRDLYAAILGKQHAHDAEIERAVEARFGREKAAADAARKREIEKAVKQALAVAEKKLELLRANQEAMIAARVGTEREAGAKRLDEALQAAKLEHATEKLRLETALAELTRRVQAKPPHAVGPPAEKSLQEQIATMLAEMAPLDRVERVGPGVRGADVIVSVIHPETNAIAGTIVIESKAISRWNSSYTRVLRDNQIRVGGAFGILSTTTMPANCRELAVIDNTIVCAPERVPVLVAILRRIVLDNFVQRLGAEERNDKAARLYTFMLSRACGEMFDTLLRLGRDLTELDAAAAKSNQQIFAKRAKLIQGVLNIREQFVAVVADIVGGGQ